MSCTEFVTKYICCCFASNEPNNEATVNERTPLLQNNGSEKSVLPVSKSVDSSPKSLPKLLIPELDTIDNNINNILHKTASYIIDVSSDANSTNNINVNGINPYKSETSKENEAEVSLIPQDLIDKLNRVLLVSIPDIHLYKKDQANNVQRASNQNIINYIHQTKTTEINPDTIISQIHEVLQQSNKQNSESHSDFHNKVCEWSFDMAQLLEDCQIVHKGNFVIEF